jgi:hypothetical protein
MKLINHTPSHGGRLMKYILLYQDANICLCVSFYLKAILSKISLFACLTLYPNPHNLFDFHDTNKTTSVDVLF